jgi:hypothetical protein
MKTKSGKSLLLMVATAVAATLAAASPSLSGETRPFMTLDMAKTMADACEA